MKIFVGLLIWFVLCAAVLAGCAATAVNVNWNPMSAGTKDTLFSVWVSSPSNVFAVGDDNSGSVILQYDGRTWSMMNFSADYGLASIWGSSPADVFAVGGNNSGNTAVLHYDGKNWSAMTVSPADDFLAAVWGTSSTDVFAVGKQGNIIYYNGTAWSNMIGATTNTINDVWGTSSSDVFAVGHLPGTILHYSGRTWNPMTSNTQDTIESAWRSSPSDVFAWVGTVPAVASSCIITVKRGAR